MKRRICLIVRALLAAMLLPLGQVAYASLTFTQVSGSGTYNGDLGLITDGSFPAEGGQWQTSTVWWNGTTPAFTLDLGGVYAIDDLVLSVDNNDSYSVKYSSDGTGWVDLLNISQSYGEIGWGMDTMSTDSSDPEYISYLDFAPVNARYFLISAIDGDNSYSIGEFHAEGTSVVPIPAAAWLFGSGLLGLAGFGARRKRR